VGAAGEPAGAGAGGALLPLKVLASRVLVEGHGEEWSATGMSTAGDVERLEGFHADGGVLVIIDEMKAVPQEAFDAVQGRSRVGGLAAAGDERPRWGGQRPFWKACQDGRRWRVHHLPSPDSSLVAPSWVEDRAADWGIGSPLYQSRVMGQFADAGEGVLYPLGLLEQATARVLMCPRTRRCCWAWT